MSPHDKALDVLVQRARQRGFLTVAEIQQELLEAEAPADSFEAAFDQLQNLSVRVEEDGPDALDAAPLRRVGVESPGVRGTGPALCTVFA